MIVLFDRFLYNNWIEMVDCDYFTDFNKDLTIESDRILL